MTPQDFATLAEFLYGPHWRELMPEDTRLRADNVKRVMSGRRNVPPPVAEFLLRRVADRWLLRGWQDEPPPAGLSPDTAADLAQRIARAKMTQDRPED